MMKSDIMKGALLACCLIGMLVLPAAAAGQGTTSASPAAIDAGLKDDLWNIHTQYRLQAFDNHVQEAGAVIDALNKYGIDTTQMQKTLDAISSRRSELQTDLQNRDRKALQTLNGELQALWKQFREEMKETMKNHYQALKAQRAGAKAGAGGATVVPTVATAAV